MQFITSLNGKLTWKKTTWQIYMTPYSANSENEELIKPSDTKIITVFLQIFFCKRWGNYPKLISLLIFELGLPFRSFKLYHFAHIAFCAKNIYELFNERGEKKEKKEGKYSLRPSPELILPFNSLSNSHTGSCNPGNTALLAWKDRWALLQELIFPSPLVPSKTTGKYNLGVLQF